jgi:nicotinamidase-related amidase
MVEHAKVPGWRDVIGPRDRRVYAAAGYGERVQPGTRPVLLVIDVTYGFLGREPADIMTAIRTYPNACGEAGWAAVATIERLLPMARTLDRPVIYSAGFSRLGVRGVGLWAAKHPRASHAPADAHEIPTPIAPREGADVLLEKTKPSLFHGTPLLDLLVGAGADTLIVTGGTTSGCVRATVVDAFSYGWPVIVVEDGVFDRGELSHAVDLFDMDQKYANVWSADETIGYLAALTPVN